MFNAKNNSTIKFILEDIEECNSIKFREDIGDSMLNKISSRYGSDFAPDKILFIIKTSMFFWNVDDIIVVTKDKALFTKDETRPIITYADIDRIEFREDTVSDNYVRVFKRNNTKTVIRYPGIDKQQAVALLYGMNELRKNTSQSEIYNNVRKLNKKYLMKNSNMLPFYREAGRGAFIYGVYPSFEYVKCIFDVDVVMDRMEKSANVGSTTKAILKGLAGAAYAIENKKEEMRRTRKG